MRFFKTLQISEETMKVQPAVQTNDNPRFVSTLTRNTLALILAGGRGTRLKNLTDWRAKPAVPFGGKFRIIDFTLSNCVNSGVRRIGVVTQYKAQSLIRHIQRGWSFLDGRFQEFIELLPAQQRTEEGTWYQGTADAVFQNLDILRTHNPGYVLILGGDHIYKMDYGRILAEHVERQADLTIACLEVPVEDASAFGVMAVDDSWRTTSFAEKPEHPAPIPGKPGHALISMGIYVFNAKFLYEQLIQDHDMDQSSHDFGKDVIPRLVASNARVYAHRFQNSCVNMASGVPYWRDVGTVDAYWKANIDLTTITPDLNLYDEDWPIWTHQEQLPLMMHPPNLCSTMMIVVVRRWIQWYPAGASSVVQQYAAPCCFPMFRYVATALSKIRSSSPMSASTDTPTSNG